MRSLTPIVYTKAVRHIRERAREAGEFIDLYWHPYRDARHQRGHDPDTVKREAAAERFATMTAHAVMLDLRPSDLGRRGHGIETTAPESPA
jgi:hypothetical protein